jgi:hypothetical protein
MSKAVRAALNKLLDALENTLTDETLSTEECLDGIIEAADMAYTALGRPNNLRYEEGDLQ